MITIILRELQSDKKYMLLRMKSDDYYYAIVNNNNIAQGAFYLTEK